jgi:carbon storage regulator
MLVLSRRVGETVVIDGGIRVTVVEMHGNKVRLGIEAPPAVRVDREEVHRRLAEFAPPPTSQPDEHSVPGSAG